MAFYTPSWLRKVIKEDASYISDHISKSTKNDFRSYVDAKLPFTLWLEIGEIESKVLKPSEDLLNKTIEAVFPKEQHAWAKDTLKTVLLNAYRSVINKYIDATGFISITPTELEEMLKPLQTLSVGEIRPYLDSMFKGKTYRVSGSISTKDKSVMLIAPNFTAIRFGTHFRDSIDLSPFGTSDTLIEDSNGQLVQSPYSKIKDILEDVTGKISGKKQSFYTQLQNVGHIEVDVVSATTREVKRGQVSPRFLQALVSVPNTKEALRKLQVSFSKQTKQADTRVIVRKKFTKSKLVFELLVEYGIPVGIPESQVTNLQKAALERSFGPGSGLTKKIESNPDLLTQLETSKSVNQYILQSMLSMLKDGKPLADYSSLFKDISKNTFKTQKVSVNITKRSASNITNKKVSKAPKSFTTTATNLISLQNLLNANLAQKIKENMGDGSRHDILNLRSGRFAESAKVERLSESRQGMITAFYTYMKNPYATFSEGGRQQYPRSRDPKLLISKSIREIAAEQVANRMRAVVV